MSKRSLPVSAPIIFLLLLFLVGPAALLQGNNPLLWMLCVLIVVGVAAWLASRAIVRNLDVRRLLPDHGAVGEPLVVGYEIHRSTRLLPAFDLTMAERVEGVDAQRTCPAWILHVGPGETVHGEGLFVPTSRGRLILEHLEIRTGFPMGILPRRRRIHVRQDVLIHPEILRLRPDLVRGIVGIGLSGRRSMDRHGNGLEYYGTRPVRPGDGLRDIAWKTSARRNDLVAIERARPSAPRLRVVLDLTVASEALQVGSDEPITGRELEEQAISLAASILRDACGRGYDAGLSVQGISMPPHHLRGGLRHFGRMLAALADLDLNQLRQDWVSLPEQERAGLVIIHPDRVRHQARRSDAWHLTARHLADLIEQPRCPEATPATPPHGSGKEVAA
jgi:uncharacterized protein (DUF58 family)